MTSYDATTLTFSPARARRIYQAARHITKFNIRDSIEVMESASISTTGTKQVLLRTNPAVSRTKPVLDHPGSEVSALCCLMQWMLPAAAPESPLVTEPKS